MKFTQFEIVDWTDGKGRGYTVFALGEDGRIYKSLPQFGGPNHAGWIPLRDEILPEDARIPRPERHKKTAAQTSTETPNEAPVAVAV